MLIFFLLCLSPLFSFWKPLSTRVPLSSSHQKVEAICLLNSSYDLLISQGRSLWLWENFSWRHLTKLPENKGSVKKIVRYWQNGAILFFDSDLYHCHWSTDGCILKKLKKPFSDQVFIDGCVSDKGTLWILCDQGIFYSKDLGKRWSCLKNSSFLQHSPMSSRGFLITKKTVFLLQKKTFSIYSRKKRKWLKHFSLEETQHNEWAFLKKNNSTHGQESLPKSMHMDENSKIIWIHHKDSLIAFYWDPDQRDYAHLSSTKFLKNTAIKDFCCWKAPWISTQKGCFTLHKIDRYWSKVQTTGNNFCPDLLWTFSHQLFAWSQGVLYQWISIPHIPAYDYFENEPTIQDLHCHVLSYQELQKKDCSTKVGFIETLRWIPQLSISFRSGRENNWKIYSDGKTFQSPYEDDQEFRIACVWNFEKDKDMMNETEWEKAKNKKIELREKLLKKVTSIYFERRKEQLSLFLQSDWTEIQKISRSIKIQELTAHLDAYTGGWFSKNIRKIRGPSKKNICYS